jgi:excinuclease UvrABC nuclease subunit
MILEKLKDIPKNAGCYLFKDNKDQIIYVGMSKFLPKRVTSYFQKNQTGKTKALVENISDVEFKIASSEQEAIILEEELIKLYKPKFNIKGKDDKTRKWSLCFTEEEFPKLEIVRDKQDDRVSLDFTSGMLCREIYDLIHDVFELRSCSYDLTEENIKKEKFKTCLEYHLGRCSAPCIGLQSKILFTKTIKDVKSILQLDFKSVTTGLKKEMKYYSSNLEFEKAQNVLSKLEILKTIDNKLNVIRLQKYNKKAFDIKNVLGLMNIPQIIEAFDNSHNQGDSNVAASVRFKNENPDKSEYRKYIIRSFTGVDDYQSFDEVLNRRFKRLIEEKQKLPDLVIIDGGKGQLGVAKRVFENLGILNQVDLISISKDSNHKSSIIHKIDGSEFNIYDDKNFTLFGKIQEEVHRFAIKFHREKQSKKLFL